MSGKEKTEIFGKMVANIDGNVVLSIGDMPELVFPPDAAVKIACLMLTMAGCEVKIKDYRITADASRVSARVLNTDARRKYDA